MVALGRALWTPGVTGLTMTSSEVRVRKVDAMPWDFLEPKLGQILVERLTLAQADGSAS